MNKKHFTKYMLDMTNIGTIKNPTIIYEYKSSSCGDTFLLHLLIKDEKIIDVPKVAILDPACGTGTFGAEIIKFIKDKYYKNLYKYHYNYQFLILILQFQTNLNYLLEVQFFLPNLWIILTGFQWIS